MMRMRSRLAARSLRRLFFFVQSDHFRACSIAGSCIALERCRPEVAEVAPGIVDRVARVNRVDDPVGLQDLDPSLVGVDAMLSDENRTARFDRGARRK